jgi:hypothetical protein
MREIESGKIGPTLGAACFSKEEVELGAKEAEQALAVYETVQFGGASRAAKAIAKGGVKAAKGAAQIGKKIHEIKKEEEEEDQENEKCE